MLLRQQQERPPGSGQAGVLSQVQQRQPLSQHEQQPVSFYDGSLRLCHLGNSNTIDGGLQGFAVVFDCSCTTARVHAVKSGCVLDSGVHRLW